MVQAHYNGFYWIKAEIAKLNFYPKTGHCFPDLVEKKEGKIVAEMKATIWNIQYQKINQKFLKIAQQPLKEGMNVLLKAKLNYHPTYGISLQISHVDPFYTLGEMANEKQESIALLKKQALFEANKKLNFPELPKRLAIISYNTSKGYQDFLQIIANFKEKYRIQYQLFPSLLQGDKAVDTLLNELANVESKLANFDLVLIIRGGGGDVGMHCYNNFNLAKRVATFPVPIITGIGHSTNETVVEMVAYKNCITPTDVAYEIISHFQEKEQSLEQASQRLTKALTSLVEKESIQLKVLHQRLQHQSKMLLLWNEQHITRTKDNLNDRLNAYFQQYHHQLNLARQQMHIPTKYLFQKNNEELSNLEEILSKSVNHYIENKQMEISVLNKKLAMLTPENNFKRGYTLTTKNGKILRSSSEITNDDELITYFKDGKISSKVVNKKNDPERSS